MIILLCSIGTRGDIEPFIAIGALLQKQNHRVVYCFPQQFSAILPNEASSYPLSPKVVELIHSEAGNRVMGRASLLDKGKALWQLYREGQKVNRELTVALFSASQKVKPDLIVHHPKCAFPFLWALKENRPTIMISPVPYFIHYVKDHAHLGFGGNWGRYLNRWSYRLALMGLAYNVKSCQSNLPPRFSFPIKRIRKAILNKKILFHISPVLFSRPSYWPAQAQILGYYSRTQSRTGTLPSELQHFINRHKKVVMLTLGSMVGTDPTEISRCLYQALDELAIPTLVNTADGGLVELPEYRENQCFYFARELPYEQIMPQLYAVIHHGGAGTTHSALKHGCASMIIPHIIDQYAWNNLIDKHGAGPKGLAIKKLKPSLLKPLLNDLYQYKAYKRRAEELAQAMAKENFQYALYRFLVDRPL